MDEIEARPTIPSEPGPRAIGSGQRFGDVIGIDANRPLTDDGAIAPQVADPGIIADTGAGWVRLNFVLGPWTSVTDGTRHHGRTWQEAYRAIIEGFRSRGVRIYALVSNEAVRPADFGDLFRGSPGGATSHPWIDGYVESFVSIARMFGRDVDVFEMINEPDNWHGAPNGPNWVHPGWFAIMLQRIYQAVRSDPQIPNIPLVSGPLEGLQQGNGAKSYLETTYREGVDHLGWSQGGRPFPFDGVGYHLYVEQGRKDWPSQRLAVQQKYRSYLDQMQNVIRIAEGRDKPIYVSEMGWFSNGGKEDLQAQCVPLGLEILARDPRVKLVVHFCTQDFGLEGGDKFYGLYRPGAVSQASRKPVYSIFQQFCSRVVTETVIPPPDKLPPMPTGLTNQDIIDAFRIVSSAFGLGNWDLMSRVGLKLSQLAAARGAPYSGPGIADLPGLSHSARVALLNRLMQPAAAARSLAHERGLLIAQPELATTAMAFPKELHIRAMRGVTGVERVVAQAWNRYGSLLAAVADALQLDLTTVVALAPDAHAFTSDSRLHIRFEVDVFFDRWGSGHPDAFKEYFAFDATRPGRGHAWRPSPRVGWLPVHKSQTAEWAAFAQARGLDGADAFESVRIGLPQIMGFNYDLLGYSSAQSMFQAFAASDRSQLLSWFDLIAGPDADSREIRALRAGNLEGFAALHFGCAEAAPQARRLREAVAAFRRLNPFTE